MTIARCNTGSLNRCCSACLTDLFEITTASAEENNFQNETYYTILFKYRYHARDLKKSMKHVIGNVVN